MPAAFAGLQTGSRCGMPRLALHCHNLHTGHVASSGEVDDAPAPLYAWEDPVEVPFRPTAKPLALVQRAREAASPTPSGSGKRPNVWPAERTVVRDERTGWRS